MRVTYQIKQIRNKEFRHLVLNRLSDSQTRLLGFLPLSFFFAQAFHYWQINELGHTLWMCNIGNLVLAIGIFLKQPILIRVAVMWAVPGLVVWSIYVVPTWGTLFTGQYSFTQLFGALSSSLAHLGGLSVGLIILRRVGMDRWAFVYAFGWYLVMQGVTRLFTPAVMNVNLAHRIQDGFEGAFSSYLKFWLLLTFLVAVFAWLIGYVLQKIWPARDSVSRRQLHVSGFEDSERVVL